MLVQTPASLWSWIGLHGYGWLGVSKGISVKAFTFLSIYNIAALTCFRPEKEDRKSESKKLQTLREMSVRMVGCGAIWRVKLKARHWSTSEERSERPGWMRGQHENHFFCLCSWLVKRRSILQPELVLYKSEACKQGYLSLTSTHTLATTHVCTVMSRRWSLNDVMVRQWGNFKTEDGGAAWA